MISNSESDRLLCLITQINTKKILQLEINKLHKVNNSYCCCVCWCYINLAIRAGRVCVCEKDRQRERGRYVNVMEWERESKGSLSFSDISFYQFFSCSASCRSSAFRFFCAFFIFFIIIIIFFCFVISLNSTIFVLGH